MPKGRPKAAAQLASMASVEYLLCDLQRDIECRGSEVSKQRRRAILRGFRAGFYSAIDKPTKAEVAALLRAELYGHPLPVTCVDDVQDDGCDPWLMAMESGPTTCAGLAHQTEESSDD
ncbi:hypothetical protein [Pseudomonas fluorescens]|uniref:Uncharacterized protein n=1 Tax=Pseudomonas fluorescens TaxID=294 RepID=A0A5E7EZ70_PSEFL|nr:hypothetical protein [Pseudomonas fluorescens]VVO32169.1 hypothetical protein PS691_05030 [Pseudomonas fluorescens]